MNFVPLLGSFSDLYGPDLIVILAVLVVSLFILSGLLLWLWNTTIPTVFNLRRITYWEAFRLLLIASVLFGRSVWSWML